MPGAAATAKSPTCRGGGGDVGERRYIMTGARPITISFSSLI